MRDGATPSLPLIALLTMCLLLLAGAAAAQSLDYRRPLGNDPSTLDPARISDIYGRSVAQQIFDGLVAFDQTLALEAELQRGLIGSPNQLAAVSAGFTKEPAEFVDP